MKEILQQINSVDGVIGSALFNQKGDILFHVFPPLIDSPSIKQAASLTLECTHGLQISQTLDLFDLRFADGRILVKTFSDVMLFLLCTNRINLQLLSITLNLAIKKLDAKLSSAAVETQKTSVNENKHTNNAILQMNISHLANKQASASFDSLGMVAVSQPTFQYISDFYKSPFKKLILTNSSAGTTGNFPVMIMKDMDIQYDGCVVVGPGIEKKLKVNEGDSVEVEIV